MKLHFSHPNDAILEINDESNGSQKFFAFAGYWIDALETSVLNDVIALIDEGVSNAIRHAKASTITVSGSRVGADVHLEILSNGSGMTDQVPGLGTKLFNELTSSYEYTNRGDLNLLKFTVRSAPLVEL